MNLCEISLINNQYCCAIKGLPRGSLECSGRGKQTGTISIGSMDRGLPTAANGKERVPQAKDIRSSNRCSFHMPLHYPRYTGADYESMPEWMLDRLLSDYGILIDAAVDVDSKRRFAMGTFLWPAAH
ncbi:uncharacterized protein LOC122001867 [Zingiber officinale]|uniref:uncharacterized protein LOC122001867 n=1 Tax=Zingiber officinale TaxID=94328 RepID=UPI001C4C9F31|nr:uncharacterized protein LOC122001867 [Zingiber officinale]